MSLTALLLNVGKVKEISENELLWYLELPAHQVCLVKINRRSSPPVQKTVRWLTQEFNHVSQLEIKHNKICNRHAKQNFAF